MSKNCTQNLSSALWLPPLLEATLIFLLIYLLDLCNSFSRVLLRLWGFCVCLHSICIQTKADIPAREQWATLLQTVSWLWFRFGWTAGQIATILSVNNEQEIKCILNKQCSFVVKECGSWTQLHVSPTANIWPFMCRIHMDLMTSRSDIGSQTGTYVYLKVKGTYFLRWCLFTLHG